MVFFRSTITKMANIVRKIKQSTNASKLLYTITLQPTNMTQQVLIKITNSCKAF